MIVHLKRVTVSRVFEKEGDREWGVGRDAVPLGKWVEKGHIWPRKTNTKGQRQGPNIMQRQGLIG